MSLLLPATFLFPICCEHYLPDIRSYELQVHIIRSFGDFRVQGAGVQTRRESESSQTEEGHQSVSCFQAFMGGSGCFDDFDGVLDQIYTDRLGGLQEGWSDNFLSPCPRKASLRELELPLLDCSLCNHRTGSDEEVRFPRFRRGLRIVMFVVVT